MASGPRRATYRHGNLRAEAIAAAYHLATQGGLKALTLRRVAEAVGVAHRSLYNHFRDREALEDAVAEAGFLEMGATLKDAPTAEAFVARYVGFALAHRQLYEVMSSRPHATMKLKPTLQAAVHLGITEALRLFGRPARSSAENRRAVMKMLILVRGGISMHLAGILDVADDEDLIAELQAMVASG